MPDSGRDPWLLTPGPLTTSDTTKSAMLHDWGSRDGEFIEMNQKVRARLLEIASASQTHVCVCLQGSGTFAIEAALGTVVPRHGKLLVLVNGAYGRRMVKIAGIIGRACAVLETAENEVPQPADVEAALEADAAVTHVAVVHCETTSGILNPVEAIAEVVARHRKRLLIDAMSSFGAIDLDARRVPFDVVIASTNKCLEGIPGMGFVLVRRSVLEDCEGNAHSLSLDLYDQWRYAEANGQWRFTPPTHVIAAFVQALEEHRQEGGVAGRNQRYTRNCRMLVDGMRALGFHTFLPDALQAPIIVTFRSPADPNWEFTAFYEDLRRRGFVIYPGKLTQKDSFRIGCIGRLGESQMEGALAAIRQSLERLQIKHCGPRPEPAGTS